MGISVFPTPSATTNTQPSWTLISSSQGGVNEVTFSSISGYRKLRIVLQGIEGSMSNEQANVLLRLNGDSNANYSRAGLLVSTVSSTSPMTQDTPGAAYSSYTLTRILAANSINNLYKGFGVIEFDNANVSDKMKIITGWWSSSQTNGIQPSFYNIYGTYRNATASEITSITLTANTGNFATLTSPNGIYLYGAN